MTNRHHEIYAIPMLFFESYDFCERLMKMSFLYSNIKCLWMMALSLLEDCRAGA